MERKVAEQMVSEARKNVGVTQSQVNQLEEKQAAMDQRLRMSSVELEAFDIKSIRPLLEKFKKEQSSIKIRLGLFDQWQSDKWEETERIARISADLDTVNTKITKTLQFPATLATQKE